MSNQSSRIRNRSLRAYGVIAFAVIMVIVLIILIYGLVTKPASNTLEATPTPEATEKIIDETAEPTENVEETPTADPNATPTVEPTGSSENAYMYVKVSGSKLNMRDKPSTEGSNVIGSLDKGVVVTVIGTPEEAADWSNIKTAEGTEGFVKTEFLAQPPIPVNAVVNVTDSMNLRAQPSTTSAKVTTLKANDAVIITQYDIAGGWVKVKTADDKVGYCKQEFLKGAEG